MIVVKFSTLAGGVFIEVTSEDRGGQTRCFRFDKDGNVEWTHKANLEGRDPAPRWYAHAFKADQFILC